MCRSVLFALVAAACIGCRGDGNVDSTSAYAGGIIIDHQWSIGTPPQVYGLTQYRDAGVPWPSEQWSAARSQACTRIELGRRQITVRASAWVVCIGAVFLSGSLLALGGSGWWWLSSRLRVKSQE